MGFLDKLFHKEEEVLPEVSDLDVVAVCSGKLIPAEEISDPVFSTSMMGQTIAIEPDNSDIVSPVNGTIETMFATGHAFCVRAEDGTGYLIHIGINTVEMRGDGFEALKKEGATVKAGEKVVSVDFGKVKAKGYPCTTMLIVTEPVDGREYQYIDFGKVEKNQVISK